MCETENVIHHTARQTPEGSPPLMGCWKPPTEINLTRLNEMIPENLNEAADGGLPPSTGSASSFWWELWKHMHDEHGLILVESECDAIANAVDESRSVKGAVAMIKRNEHPEHYYGHNECGPMWTSSPFHAAPVPAAEVQDVLNEIAAKCPNVWAVIYPQNESSDGAAGYGPNSP